jgi:hypothetical protein
VVLESIKPGINERFALEEVVPLGVIEVGGDDGRLSTIAIVHAFEEGIDMLGLEGEVAELIDDQDIVSAQAPEQLRCGAVRQGGVEGIEEFLSKVAFDMNRFLQTSGSRAGEPGASLDTKGDEPASSTLDVSTRLRL